MAKLKKSTKRFQKQQANKANKAKAGVNKKAKRPFKQRKANPDGSDKAAPAKASAKEMDLDEFLDGGFEDMQDDNDAETLEGNSSDDEGSLDDNIDGDSDDDELGSGSEEEDEGDDEDDDFQDDASEELAEDEAAQLADEEKTAAAGDAVSKDNKRLRGEVGRHKAQLEALKEKDPEFWAYLQQTDAELLNFEADDDDEEDESAEESAEESDEESDEDEKKEDRVDKKAAKAKDAEKQKASTDEDDEEDQDQAMQKQGNMIVTSSLISQWISSVRSTGSLASLRHLVRAYRQACHYGDTEAQIEDGMRIASSAVYNAVMMFMLREGDEAFRKCLGLPLQDAPDKPLAHQDITKCARWRKVGPLVKSYLGNSLHALSGMTDPPLLAFSLRRLRASTPFMTPQPLRKFGDKFLKACISLWSTSEAAAPRLQAFLAIRQLAITMPPPFIEKVLRSAYKAFLANTKFVTAASAPHIAFMITCAVELWGLDMQQSYAHAFSAIRQLAVSLRGALNMKSKDAYKQIYSWQGVNALELWARVLAAHADQPALKPLVYPLVQLLLGAARLVPTPRFFPLRLRLLRATTKLAAATHTYVPLAPPLLDMLHWSELTKKPKGGPGASPDLSLILRAGKNTLRTTGFQEEVVTQVMELLVEHLSLWGCHPAFPEITHLTCLQLRRFAKTTKVDKFRKAAKGVLDAIERNVTWVGNARDQADFAPRDIARVNAFLSDQQGKAPLQLYAAQLASRAAQRAAARATESIQLKAGKSTDNDDNDDSDIDEDVIGEDHDDDAGDEDLSDGDGDGDDDEGSSEEQDEETAPAASKKRAPAATKSTLTAVANGMGDDDEQDEDMVAEYQLSDDDQDDDDDGDRKAKGSVKAGQGKKHAQQAPDSDDDDEESDDEDEDQDDEDSDASELDDSESDDDGSHGSLEGLEHDDDDDEDEGNSSEEEPPTKQRKMGSDMTSRQHQGQASRGRGGGRQQQNHGAGSNRGRGGGRQQHGGRHGNGMANGQRSHGGRGRGGHQANRGRGRGGRGRH